MMIFRKKLLIRFSYICMAMLLVTNIYCYALSIRKEFHKSVYDAKSKFMDPNYSIENWNLFEKLGAAEFLYFIYDENSDDSEKIAKRIKYILANCETKNMDNDLVLSRRFILEACISNQMDNIYGNLVNKICKYDPNNGLSWLLHAEYHFFLGGRYECLNLCYKALSCKTISFRNRRSKEYMSRALDKVGLLNIDISRFLILYIGWPKKDFTIAFRHTCILSHLKYLRMLFFYGRHKKPVILFPERKYLSLLDSYSLPRSASYIGLHNTMFRMAQKNYHKVNLLKDFFIKEKKLIQDRNACISKEGKMIESIANLENESEIINILKNYDDWWQKNEKNIYGEIKRPNEFLWNEYWSELQKKSEKISKEIYYEPLKIGEPLKRINGKTGGKLVDPYSLPIRKK